ncbi:MAG: invasion associated locus B family protein [Rhodospirillaceae bacterium]
MKFSFPEQAALLPTLVLLATCLSPLGAAAQQKVTTPADKSAPPAIEPKPSDPQKLNTAAPAWTVSCVSSGRAAVANCAMEQRLFAKETGRLLSIVVVSVPGNTRQPVLWLHLPTGIALQERITLTIDAEPPRPVVVQSCDERSCAVSMPVTPGLLAVLKKSQTMTVNAVSATRETMVFRHMLTDFTVSYDAIQ